MTAPIGIDLMTLLAVGGSAAGLGWAGLDAYANRVWGHETASAYGSAAWATKRDIKRAGMFGPEGIALGRYAGRIVRLKTDRHLLTFAPNRSGKGVSSIIPNLLTWPADGSMLIVDPKGENADVTARRRRELGQAVHVLDPFGITRQPAARFNPLLWLEPFGDDLAEDAALLADGLVVSGRNEEQEFWNAEARALIAGLIMHVATTELPERRHLGTVRRLLTAPPEGVHHGRHAPHRDGRSRAPPAAFNALLDRMASNNAALGLIAGAAHRLLQKSARERSGVISTAQANTHFLDSPRMTEVLGASDFDLWDLKSGRMTIYLVLPAERLPTYGRWLRLMVSLCLAALTRDRAPPPHPVLFLLDEFAALGRLQAIETAMGLLAGYGVQLWPILQGLDQLKDLYPRRWQSFVANAGVVQAFGINDMGTAQYLSTMLGNRTVTVRQRNRDGTGHAHARSESYGPAARPLLLPQEVMHLDGEKQMLLMQGRAPILADKLCYYADPEFGGMFDPNPMVRS